MQVEGYENSFVFLQKQTCKVSKCTGSPHYLHKSNNVSVTCVDPQGRAQKDQKSWIKKKFPPKNSGFAHTLTFSVIFLQSKKMHLRIQPPPPLPSVYKISIIVKLSKIAPESSLPANKISPRSPLSGFVHAISLILQNFNSVALLYSLHKCLNHLHGVNLNVTVI